MLSSVVGSCRPNGKEPYRTNGNQFPQPMHQLITQFAVGDVAPLRERSLDPPCISAFTHRVHGLTGLGVFLEICVTCPPHWIGPLLVRRIEAEKFGSDPSHPPLSPLKIPPFNPGTARPVGAVSPGETT
jgi:hypothetical protein